jgi:hypothetical protein
LVAACDEVGTVFKELKNPEAGSLLSRLPGSSDHCPSCGEVALPGFRPATASEIQGAGFHVGEYE